MKTLLILLLLLPLSSAITTEFSCPDEVNLEEEFICSIEIFDAEGVWDVKVDLTKDGSSIARVWNEAEQKWKSAYYYLKEFISVGEQKEIKLKIESAGELQGLLKLRKGSSKEEYEFGIIVLEGDAEAPQEEFDEDGVAEETPQEEIVEEEIIQNSVNPPEETITEHVISLNKEEVLNLNNEILSENLAVYESKNYKALKYAPYIFSLFLIILLVFFVLEKL